MQIAQVDLSSYSDKELWDIYNSGTQDIESQPVYDANLPEPEGQDYATSEDLFREAGAIGGGLAAFRS